MAKGTLIVAAFFLVVGTMIYFEEVFKVIYALFIIYITGFLVEAP